MSFYVVGWPWWVAKDSRLCLLTLHSCGMGQNQKKSWVEINNCFVSEGRGDEVVQRQSLSTSRKHLMPTRSLRPPCANTHIADHGVTWQGMSLWSVAIICSDCLCSQHLVHQATSPLKGAEWEIEKVLRLCRYWSTRATTLVCYQYCFSHKIKTQLGAAMTEVVKSIVVRPMCWHSQLYHSPVLQ